MDLLAHMNSIVWYWYSVSIATLPVWSFHSPVCCALHGMAVEAVALSLSPVHVRVEWSAAFAVALPCLLFHVLNAMAVMCCE